jgi:hypothetical protein
MQRIVAAQVRPASNSRAGSAILSPRMLAPSVRRIACWSRRKPMTGTALPRARANLPVGMRRSADHEADALMIADPVHPLSSEQRAKSGDIGDRHVSRHR